MVAAKLVNVDVPLLLKSLWTPCRSNAATDPDAVIVVPVTLLVGSGAFRLVEQKDVFYHVTLMNENYAQPKMPGARRTM